MPLNGHCYFGTGKDRRLVTVAEALAIKKKLGAFTGACITQGCRSNIHVYAESRLQEAHFHTVPVMKIAP
jgi:hypothetical protein